VNKAAQIFLALLWVLRLPVAAQTPPIIGVDQELHHTLVMKNDVIKVFEIRLATREALSIHRHDYDDVTIAVSGAATVSTTPGQADILTISKPGDMSFARGGWEHSLRNIGQTEYHSVLISLLRTQTGARNLCGIVVADKPANCPAQVSDPHATRVDQHQFETDQMRVDLTRVLPGQEATFGEPGRDDLVVTIDEALIAGRKCVPGSSVWIARGGRERVLKNNSDQEVRVVTVSFQP
jgi:quercetin dioxygenase-like cupin family protein